MDGFGYTLNMVNLLCVRGCEYVCLWIIKSTRKMFRGAYKSSQLSQKLKWNIFLVFLITSLKLRLRLDVWVSVKSNTKKPTHYRYKIELAAHGMLSWDGIIRWKALSVLIWMVSLLRPFSKESAIRYLVTGR